MENITDQKISTQSQHKEVFSLPPSLKSSLNIINLESYILLLLDLIGFISSVLLAHKIRLDLFNINLIKSPYFVLTLIIIVTIFYILDLYKVNATLASLRSPGRTILATIISWAIIAILTYSLGAKNIQGTYLGRGILAIELTLFMIWAISCRLFTKKWINTKTKKLTWLAVGTKKEYKKLEKEFNDSNNNGKLHLSYLENINDHNLKNQNQLKTIKNLIFSKQWSGIIITDSVKSDPNLLKMIMNARLKGFRVFDISEFYENIWQKIPVGSIKDGWFLSSGGFNLIHSQLGLRLKRFIDISLSIFMIILTLPITVLTVLLIKLFDRGPVIYKQYRSGLNGKKFKVYKFRSMFPDSDHNHWTMKNDSRITPIGKFIRLVRIDELPQLINVIKGDMSFIGPRCETIELVTLYEDQIPYYQLRHLVRPGITGWAQVLYPYGASVDDAMEKLKYDLYYIKNYSVLLDFSIILKTVRIVLFGRGR